MDLEKFEEVFKTYFKPIRNFLYFKTSDDDLADDLAQDVFFKLWEIRDTVRMGSVKSYLYTIAGNMAINQLKREQLKFKFLNKQDADPADKHHPEFLLEEMEYKAKLEEILGGMPEGQRVVFLMNRIDDLKYREIAERLGISIKTVEKRMTKALYYIKEHLGQKM